MATRELQAGEVIIDRYRIEREIGRGGIAIVYEAHDEQFNQKLALKLLVPPPAASDSLKHRFKREAILMRDLHHKNIVRVFDYFEDGERAFLTMQLIDGLDLQQHVEKNGGLSLPALKKLALEVTDALDAAHSRGILHRDLKPSNILLDSSGAAFLADFGSAKREGQNSLITASGFVGTPLYAAPEVIEGQRPDSRADIYSLGLMLYFTFQGRLPNIHRATGAVEPSETGHLPAGLAYEPLGKIIAKSTRRAPSLRFLSTQELLLALRNEIWEDRAPQDSKCSLCGAPDFSDKGFCAVCLGEEFSSEQLSAVMLKTPKDRNLATGQITAVFGNKLSLKSLNRAFAGEQAFLVVPTVSGGKVLQELDNRGIKAHLTPAGSPVALLPRGFIFLTLELVVISVFAAAGSYPKLGIGGIVLSVIGLLLGSRIVRNPVVKGQRADVFLSQDVTRKALNIAQVLRSPALKTLWIDVIRIGSHAAELTKVSGDHTNGAAVESLISSVGDSVQKLDGLDRFLDDLESYGRGRSTPPEQIRSAIDKAELLRAALLNGIFRALSVLSQMSPSKFNERSGIEQLDAAREALEGDSQLYAEAQQEVQSFLANRA